MRLVSAQSVEGDPGEGGAHLEAMESGHAGGVLAVLEEEGAETAAGEVGVDKDGADACGIGSGVEGGGFAAGAVIAAEEGLAEAPAAAAGDAVGRGGGRGEQVGAVVDELGVEAERMIQGSLDLLRGVVVDLETSDGELDEPPQRGDVAGAGEADLEAGLEHGLSGGGGAMGMA